MKITRETSINFEIKVPDALRALVVLGRTNGAGNFEFYNDLREALLRPNISDISSVLGVIDYNKIQQEVERKFFDSLDNRNTIIDKIAELTSEIEKLKNKLLGDV